MHDLLPDFYRVDACLSKLLGLFAGISQSIFLALSVCVDVIRQWRGEALQICVDFAQMPQRRGILNKGRARLVVDEKLAESVDHFA